MLPRHAAGSFELKEGTGPITSTVSCGEFLEIYKVDKTFRVRSPESIDPDETNPNASWTFSPVDNVGSGNTIVARVFLQSSEMLKSAIFDNEIDKESATLLLHSCKEALLASEKSALRVTAKIREIIKRIESEGIETDNHGRGLNPFPQVTDLESDCGMFLVHANRAIKLICEIPSLFVDLSRTDSNFDYLGNRLENEASQHSSLLQFVKDNADGIRYLSELRNYHEHQKEKRTEINNFSLTPDSSIQVPMWHLTGDQPRPIMEEMEAAIAFLTEIAEAMFIHTIMAVVTKKFPFVIEQIAEDKIDPSNPQRYRLTIDVNQMQFEK